MTIVLHVGTDKTGTTALQAMLAINERPLAKYGVRYVRGGRPTFLNHYGLYERALADDFAPWLKVRDEVEKQATMTSVISFEGFYHLSEETLATIRDVLGGQGIRVLIYLRRQSDLVRSGIAQRIKQGTDHLRLSAYDETTLIRHGQDYLSVLEKLERVFGRDALVVRRYEKCSFVEGSLNVDFLRAAGIDIDRAGFERDFSMPGHDTNPTLDVEAMHLLDRLDQDGIELEQRKAAVRLLLGQARDSRSTFVTDEAARRIDAAFRGSNGIIAKRWFGEDVLFSEPSRFVFREPDLKVLQRYGEMLDSMLPLALLPVWRGGKQKPSQLVKAGQWVLRGEWEQSASEPLRMASGRAGVVFRVGGDGVMDLRLAIGGRWEGEAGRLRVSVNGSALYEGETAPPEQRVPAALYFRNGQVVMLEFEVEAPAGGGPVFALQDIAYSFA